MGQTYQAVVFDMDGVIFDSVLRILNGHARRVWA